jgi:hypothetical protein
MAHHQWVTKRLITISNTIDVGNRTLDDEELLKKRFTRIEIIYTILTHYG